MRGVPPIARRARWSGAAAILVAGLGLLLVASFVWANSGSRGVALCNHNGFTGPGDLSWWPPGTACDGGEPSFERIYFNAQFFLPLATAAFLATAIWAVRAARR